MAADDNDPTVKQLLDAATRAELERWFGLPSADPPSPAREREEDPEIVAVREQRARAIAAVDPALVEAHRRRTEPPAWAAEPHPPLELRVSPSLSRVDLAMAARTIAEPRDVEIPDALVDDLRECTPQALLRDLHRPELYFDKSFEMIDIAAEERVDASAAVTEVMRARYAVTEVIASPARELGDLLVELRALRLRPLPLEMIRGFANRWVTE